MILISFCPFCHFQLAGNNYQLKIQQRKNTTNTLRPWKILSGVPFSIFSLEAAYIGYHYTIATPQWENAICPSSAIDTNNPTSIGEMTMHELLHQPAALQNQNLLHHHLPPRLLLLHHLLLIVQEILPVVKMKMNLILLWHI